MTDQTRSDELILALVALWQVNPAFNVPGAKVKIYDGPFVTDLSSLRRLFIGSTGLEDDEESVSGELVSPHAANVARDEKLSITCAAWFGDGKPDMTRARRKALDIVNNATAYLRTAPGLSLPNTFYGGLDSYSLRYAQTEIGATAVYTFVLAFTARIYT